MGGVEPYKMVISPPFFGRRIGVCQRLVGIEFNGVRFDGSMDFDDARDAYQTPT